MCLQWKWPQGKLSYISFKLKLKIKYYTFIVKFGYDTECVIKLNAIQAFQ